ncbi:MAG: D-alanyl-D-alanine carboxypeptidase family protein, partial [Ruminococcus sp.]|nr:D-alanyl-D-alanine carboxypeptidase family protein [Ruminococcus sp.]
GGTAAVSADGGAVYAATETVSVEQLLEEIPAEEIAAVECTTGKVLFEKNSQEKREISHLAKLMTLLICAEKLDSGEITLDGEVTVSAEANAMQGSQIWLDKGEKIRLEELVKSITVGNANDACAALSEYMGGSLGGFTDMMNKRAKSLGMENTHFADCAGMSAETVSCAYDLALLSGELLKYDFLRDYLTCWTDTVRGGKAELVSLNRLVRTYSGITGMKCCASQSAGECGVFTAERRGMKIAVVILGCDTSENRDKYAKKLLDMCFDMFELYTPEITKDMLKKAEVTNGEQQSVKVQFSKIDAVVIPRGASGQIEIEFKREDTLAAPVKKGQKLGTLCCKMNGETLIKANLTAKSNVKKMNVPFGFLKLMYNLLEM